MLRSRSSECISGRAGVATEVNLGKVGSIFREQWEDSIDPALTFCIYAVEKATGMGISNLR